ncbi:phospholipase A [Uliginosibacterium sp. sgz301328]|uniref:phospholipase A n=1 Tax=Uliginosibacterium sp. sgz301328 TaxID=3243764 RepID=UPI00359D247F
MPKAPLLVLAFLAALAASPAMADEARDKCLLEKLNRADPDMTVAQIKAACDEVAPIGAAPGATIMPPKPVEQAQEPAQDSFITERRREEAQANVNRYAITAHRPNYLLVASYSDHRPNSEVFGAAIDAQEGDAKKVEAKFQISLKAPLALGLFDNKVDWYAAYTERAFWQVYNRKLSSPFRETNHEPETWLTTGVDFNVFGLQARSVALGYNHQSNGRGGKLSRSWNRIFGLIALDSGENFAIGIRPWWRVPEKASEDDNPDIESYMGNFDITGIYRFGNGHTVDMMVRNNLRGPSQNKGALQLGWSFPLFGHFRGYAQWFYGYGESLIDYNVLQNSIGIGLQLTDW